MYRTIIPDDIVYSLKKCFFNHWFEINSSSFLYLTCISEKRWEILYNLSINNWGLHLKMITLTPSHTFNALPILPILPHVLLSSSPPSQYNRSNSNNLSHFSLLWGFVLIFIDILMCYSCFIIMIRYCRLQQQFVSQGMISLIVWSDASHLVPCIMNGT